MLEPVDRAEFSNEVGLEISHELVNVFRKRKTTRCFAKADVDIEIIKNAVAVAATAPSGANKQPWSFAIVGDDETKQIIREKAEEEEKKFYEETAPQKWLDDLKPLHTNYQKEFITEASYLIPVFFKNFNVDEEKGKTNNYYVKESVGLATGFLISALHLCGLNVLTYTPTNRNFMVNLLGRPSNERTFMVLVVGRPTEDATAPVLSKKAMSDIMSVFQGVTGREPEASI